MIVPVLPGFARAGVEVVAVAASGDGSACPVLFLVEPPPGCNREGHRRRTWLPIRELLGAGTTVVLTTHYLEEAEELADSLAIMHQGRIVRTGTPAEVRRITATASPSSYPRTPASQFRT